MEKWDLLRAFCERVTGKPLEESAPRYLSGWEVVEALWPLNEIFRPRFTQIRTLQYDPSFEAAADIAVEALVATPLAATWVDLSAGTWRVLLERHEQALVLAVANRAGGNDRLMPVPQELPADALLGAAMLFFLWGMKLPWPPRDRSHDELPQGSARASLRLR